MELAPRFQQLIDDSNPPRLEALDELYDEAEPIAVEEMFGEWQGGLFGFGHPAETQLERINWAGKSFSGPDEVAPIVCVDAAGRRFANPIFGGARLRAMEYRGSVTATMLYDEQPMTDHLRRISDAVVIGAMETPGSDRPGYFYMTKLDGYGPPEPLEFRSGTPPCEVTAAVLREPGGPFVFEAVELEAPRADEVLVELAACGICHSDLIVSRTAGPRQLPMVLGHEGAGVVRAIGEAVTDLAVGDHVVLSYAWCGHCRNCNRQRMSYCADSALLNLLGLRLDGSAGMRIGEQRVRARFCGQSSFASYALAAAHTAVRVPADFPLELAAPLGCGVQTGAGTVFNVLQPEPGSSLAVFATGSVGLSAVMAAKLAGCDPIIAVDPKPQRRDLALELGATHAVDPEDVKRTIRRGVDYAVDCIGKPEVTRAAIGSLSSPGVCAVVGLQGGKTPLELDIAKLVGKGQTLRGVIEGEAIPREFIPRLIDLVRAGQFPVDKLITTYPFDQINEAIAATQTGDVAKAVLTF
jgi:Zn-dependent alcohol dehydrogenase